MRINHNISSMITQGSLFRTNRAMGKTIQKLSTGLRINTAADDAAGLGVSENLRTQVRGLGQAMKNTQDAIALLNIADGALNEQAEILQRMRELVIQAKNDTYTQTERDYMYEEFAALRDELDRIAAVTNYNGLMLFAAPESVGNNTRGIYDGDYANGFNTNGRSTNHAVNNNTDIWDDPADYLFGPTDQSSAHHFNMMIGANYEQADSDAYNGTYDSYGESDPANMLTIQLGQMDSNALLTPSPTGAFGMWNADLMWGSFAWDIGTGFGDTNDRDRYLDAFGPGAEGVYGDMTLTDKLNYLQQVIDGDPDGYISDPASTYISGIFNGNEGVTGLERVNRMRAKIGSFINRLEHTVNNSLNQAQNQQAAESIVRDADFATETAEMTRSSILSQSATAMLAQANVSQQAVLHLLG